MTSKQLSKFGNPDGCRLARNRRLIIFEHGAVNQNLGKRPAHFRKLHMMLEFENSTLANMTAALEHGCKMLSGDFDTSDNRKRIGDALINAAKLRKCSLVQLIEVAEHEAAAIVGPSRPSLVDTILRKFRPSL